MTQREAFEAWKKINNALGYGLSRNNVPGTDLDGYQDAFTQWQWMAWQAAQSVQVPEGWKLVPVEPTEEMLHEAQDQHIMPPRMKRLWKLLLSTAPSTKEQSND